VSTLNVPLKQANTLYTCTSISFKTIVKCENNVMFPRGKHMIDGPLSIIKH